MNTGEKSEQGGLLHLLSVRRFAPFFVTQFLGAFNDNVFKNALVVLLTFQAAQWTSLPPEILTNLAAGVFILPFFLFSATAGQIADKFDKAGLARLVKLLEMAIMGFAAAGFHFHDLSILLVALFLLGLHSTLFGPVKYAILPQHLHAHELVAGNALVESGTFVAILLGTLVGGLLAGAGGHPVWVALAGLGIAAAGYGASRFIPAAPPPVPDLRINFNPLSETWRNIAFARRERAVFLAILAISWFWLYGALFLAQFPAYAKNILGGDESSVTLLLAVFTVGIGVGSALCERLSGKQVELGLVPLGAIGLTAFGIDVWLASPQIVPGGIPLDVAALLSRVSTLRVLFDFLMIGIAGGFFIVPLYVLIQVRGDPRHRARLIATNNILNALFMVVGALGAAALLGGGLSIPALFGLAAIVNVVMASFLFVCDREYLQRCRHWLGHARGG
ncbi:MFS transporter [Propionivibrio dicarboxylicus]|uniref:Major Facilitator Superfamily protein n=1 Tax=Propionivibrio dicarboxylicus TaxID=83767 RepID=A0A1G8MYC8_9RHOO|nr:MFS transporter [Propionivibrio dicarboxylicus]SDI73018.1 Major Facilitator Superfamily protein [Propionivibrio dicarboxylicus]